MYTCGNFLVKWGNPFTRIISEFISNQIIGIKTLQINSSVKLYTCILNIYIFLIGSVICVGHTISIIQDYTTHFFSIQVHLFPF